MQVRFAGLIAKLFLLGLLLSKSAWAQEEELRIAMSGAFQPFSTVDTQGRLVGFDADVARTLAARMGRRPVLVQIGWSGIQAGLQSGKYDLICGSMAITEERARNMAFSLPYYVSGAQVFGPEGQLPRRIGVTESSTYARFLAREPERFGEAQVVAYGSEAEILAAVVAGKVDGFISDRIVGGFYLSRSSATGISPTGSLLYLESCGIAARKEDLDLVRQVNQALLGMLQSGEYEEIYQRWVGDRPDLETLLSQWGNHAALLPREQSVSVADERADGGDWRSVLALLAAGAWLTLRLSLLTAVGSLLTGLLIGLGSLSPNRLVRASAQGYVILVRGTPLLVQLFLSYFVLATALNRLAGYELVGPFLAAFLALVVNTTAYNGETLRGAIQSGGACQGHLFGGRDHPDRVDLRRAQYRVPDRPGVRPLLFSSCPLPGDDLSTFARGESL